MRELAAPNGKPPESLTLEQRNAVPGMTPEQDHRYESHPIVTGMYVYLGSGDFPSRAAGA